MGSLRLLTLALTALGCTGHTLAEVRPGQGRYVQSGSIAVDPRTDTAFVLRGARGRNVLYAVRADGKTHVIVDLQGRSDIRVLFPDRGVLVMSERDERDRLELFDASTFARLRTVERDASYHGTRMSPSKRWLAVADNNKNSPHIHIVDTDTLATHVIPHDGVWLEAMWLNKTDTLVAIVFYATAVGRWSTRVLSWSMKSVAAAGFKPDASGFWPKPEHDLRLEDVGPDLFFSFTWVGISPDDRWAAFPVCRIPAPGVDVELDAAAGSAARGNGRGLDGDEERSEEAAKSALETGLRGLAKCEHQLLVLETSTGTLRKVDDALGPVGFTAAGSTIVSYRKAASGNKQDLLLVDPRTLETTQIEVPITGGVSYFVTREGNYLVAASSDGTSPLTLINLGTGKQRVLGTTAVGFQQFVSRIGHQELWLVFKGTLFRLDLAGGTLEAVHAGVSPAHVNLLPGRDLLVLDDKKSDQLIFFDPVKRKRVRAISLP